MGPDSGAALGHYLWRPEGVADLDKLATGNNDFLECGQCCYDQQRPGGAIVGKSLMSFLARPGPSSCRSPTRIQNRRPVTDAKEVGVGNPVGRNVLSPDTTPYSRSCFEFQPVPWHSLTLFCQLLDFGVAAGRWSDGGVRHCRKVSGQLRLNGSELLGRDGDFVIHLHQVLAGDFLEVLFAWSRANAAEFDGGRTD